METPKPKHEQYGPFLEDFVYGPVDPLNEQSDAYIMKDGKEYNLTFRELHQHCAREIRTYDSLSPSWRIKTQLLNDPNYKPLQPFEGHRARRGRWRG